MAKKEKDYDIDTIKTFILVAICLSVFSFAMSLNVSIQIKELKNTQYDSGPSLHIDYDELTDTLNSVSEKYGCGNTLYYWSHKEELWCTKTTCKGEFCKEETIKIYEK